MKPKRIITAAIMTISMLVIQGLMPFGYNWYINKLRWEAPPFGFMIVIVLVSVLYFLLTILMWIDGVGGEIFKD